MSFQEQLRHTIRECGLTNAKVAELANTYPSNISNLVNGKSSATIDTIIKILDVMGKELAIVDKK